MEISSTTTAHHQLCTQKLMMAAGASSLMEEVAVSRNSKPRQQSPAATETQATVERKPRPNPDKAIKCARCNSTKTKFCYYNNYSMAQPRYFCKQCRRYWTQGGSLRNVPVGGGCRKNRRSSAVSASVPPPSAAAPKINNKLIMPEAMVPPSFTDFPNVLPTFSFELPRVDHPSLAFASSSSNPAEALTPGGTTFLDILTGGLVDGNHRSNGHYGPTGGNGMVVVMPPPPTFGVGAGLNDHLMMQQHGLGDHAVGGTTAATHEGVLLDHGSMDAGEEGGGGVKAMMGLQWPSSQLGGGGGGSAGRRQQQQQGTVNSNNVMMDNNSSSSSSNSNNGCYWNNEGVGAANPNPNPWQGLINSSFL